MQRDVHSCDMGIFLSSRTVADVEPVRKRWGRLSFCISQKMCSVLSDWFSWIAAKVFCHYLSAWVWALNAVVEVQKSQHWLFKQKKTQRSLCGGWARGLFDQHPFSGWQLVPTASAWCQGPAAVLQHGEVDVDGDFFPGHYWKVTRASVTGGRGKKTNLTSKIFFHWDWSELLRGFPTFRGTSWKHMLGVRLLIQSPPISVVAR